MSLGTFDINLLAVFDALQVERSVTKAAVRLGLTQSAVSAALARLRDYFEDELFVWNGRTMHVTPKADAMAARVKSILAGTLRVLNEGADDLAYARHELTIASVDHIESLIGPALVKEAELSAPNITINMVDAEPTMYSRSGPSSIDLLILPSGYVPPGSARSVHILQDRYVAIAGADNDTAWPGMTQAEFLRLPLVMFSAFPRETRSSFANWLLAHGIDLDCCFRTSHLNLLPSYVEASDCIAVVPANVVRFGLRQNNIKMFAPPIPLPAIEISMYWQSMYDDDPVQCWLRDTVIRIAHQVQAESE